jgi:hypothetical protein
MSYDSQPAGNIPLNCNRYQPGFPTLATSVSIKPLRSNGRVWFPCCDGVRFPSRPVLQIGKRSLHTGEVVGSIPTAPTSNWLINQRLSRVSRGHRLATRSRTPHEHAPTIRGKSGEYVLGVFASKICPYMGMCSFGGWETFAFLFSGISMGACGTPWSLPHRLSGALLCGSPPIGAQPRLNGRSGGTARTNLVQWLSRKWGSIRPSHYV